MTATNLKVDPDLEVALVDLLKSGPFRVQFFEAVRLLRRLLPHRRPIGHFVPPGTEAVRFVAHPSLDFPASEIQSLEWPQTPEAQVKMMVNFMGLCAPNGVLPPPYTELIIEWSKNYIAKAKFENGFSD